MFQTASPWGRTRGHYYMALTETRPETDGGGTVVVESPAPTQFERLVGTGDHLSNGRLYIGFALFFLAVSAAGLGVAALDRTTSDGLLGGVSDVLWPSSLVALVLMGVMPLLIGLGIHVVPLQLGAPAIAFPRAAALSLWTWLMGALLFVTAVVLDGGVHGKDPDAVRIGNLSMGVMMAALALGAVCVATTVWSLRPIGMGLARVPLFSWSMLVAAPIWILTMGSTVAHVFLGQISRANAAGLADGFDSGIAWFLRAPAVYMLAIPVLGIAADAVGHATGRRLAPYGVFQAAIAAFGVLSFGVWTQSDMAPQTIIWVGFVVLAGLPVLALLGGLAGVIRGGPAGPGGMLSFAAALLGLLVLLGGVAAAAIQALDTAGSGSLWSLDTGLLGEAQTLFVVTAAALGGLAGVAHWGERIFGTSLTGGAGRVGWAAVLLGGALSATVLLVEGIAAGDGRDGLPDGLVYGLVAAGALLFLLGVLGALAASLAAARASYEGQVPAGAPEGGTLEWSSRGLALSGGQSEVPVVRTPYPLLDLRDGGASDEESN